ncbi:serine/threonine-protein kinase [Pseudomonas schmalbachii]|uniref:non-specific serine/threonine protein kinase n=1 Tax=Pseudomonas schmalbachii TaxID=2816993 RepID=A0ABS3TXN0_9PSED|nr:serine/threonine-protein kinase [Pseudomonas schmalbachii]MBO3277349.1 serine/threonine protein kinase [Pseudomonas schmalbachii]
MSEMDVADNPTCFEIPGEHGALPAPPLPPGELPEVLNGRYRIERLLGVGGMGAVYRARDLLREQFGEPDPYVAVKVISETFAEYPDASTLLYSEFALTMRLHHPHVVRLYDFAVDLQCRRAFITQELMRGLTLDRLLCERPQGLVWNELREIALPLLDALAYSHERGVLHGDLKPSNVMLAEDGLRLFDYGLGQSRDGVLPGLPRLCREHIAAWTPRYAAPELLDGAPLSTATDIFSVACVLYELACGKHPFPKDTQTVQVDRQPPAPASLPTHCWRALRTALSQSAEDRRISARELHEAFNTAVPGNRRRWIDWRAR